MKKLIKLSFFLLLAGCSFSGVQETDLYLQGPGIKTKHGLVVSAHPQASSIGAYILGKGGNAIDAAVATELALAVCYPEAGNIGGGGFMVIRLSDGTAATIDYREKAPGKASRDMYLGTDGEVIEGLSTDTHLASGVPGSVDGIIQAHTRFGKLPFADVIQPAIDLAGEGFPITNKQAASLNSERESFLNRNSWKTPFVKDSLWKSGDILVQPELANTLKLIRDNGRSGFYEGITADLIEQEMARGNGLISKNDLKEYSAVWRDPLRYKYKDLDIITIAPPSGGGIIFLQLLGIISNYDLKSMGFHSTEAIHLITEAEKRVFADRAEFAGDPDFVKVPVEQLIGRNYLLARMNDFKNDKATPSAQISHGNPEIPYPEETTHFSVVDKWGNAVATTTTLNGSFGSCIAVKGAGFLLNNEMDDFSVKPGFPNMYGLIGGEANSILAGKRMLSSMTPSIVEKDKKLYMVLGSPGGSTIPTSVFQVFINVAEYGMNMQEAVDANRFHHQWLPDQIVYERNGIDTETIRKLENMGQILNPRSAIGRVNAIRIYDDGIMEAGADPRGDNTATGPAMRR